MIKRFVSFLFLLTFVGGAFAQTWDAAGDYAQANPNGAWSYGYKKAGSDEFLPMAPRPDGTCGFGLEAMTCQSAWPKAGNPLPQVGTNRTGAAIVHTQQGADTHMVIPTGTLNLRAGIEFEAPVVRWTAPERSRYVFVGSVQVADYCSTGQVLHITTEGRPLQDKPLAARFGDARHFVMRRTVEQGASVDFAVETLNNWYCGSTELRLSVTKIED